MVTQINTNKKTFDENMIGTELGGWRRTVYSNQLDPSMDGKEVTVMGWISSVRDHGNLVFVLLNDKEGQMQITAKAGVCPDEIKESLVKLKEQSTIAVKGIIKPSAKAPRGVEISPSELRVFSVVEKIAPFQWQTKTVPNIDTRLELRAIDLRRNILQHVFKMRSLVLKSIRDYLYEKEFLEVNTPKMIATAAEGGAALFPIFYYDREAFLAQSPQLYKEQLTMAFENVFEIGPIFRAEPSRTNRHLSESISIDVEKAFVDYKDIMSLLERLILHVLDSVKEKNQNDLAYLDFESLNIELPFPKYTYSDLIEQLQEGGQRVTWGDDLSPQTMKDLPDERMNGFYFITDWPTSTKPFYVKPKSVAESERVSESFDLMYGSLEISSGSTRINRKDELLERMKKQGFCS